MRTIRFAASLALLSAVGVGSVAGQVSFGVAGLYATLSGSDFSGTNAGIGADGQVRFSLGSAVTLGAGAQYTTHSVDGISENFNVIGIFAEPRYMFAAGASKVHPYLAGRGGWLRQSISSGGNDLKASGFFFGGGGGLVVGLGTSASLDLSVIFASVNFGEQELNGSPTGFKPSGTSLALRAGILFGGGGQ